MSITPNHAVTAVLPKSLRAILFWASSIAGAVVLWQLEPASRGWGPYRFIVILLTVLTIFVVWALGWLLFSGAKRRRDDAARSETAYPTNRPIG